MNSRQLHSLILIGWLIFCQGISNAVENTDQINQATEILRGIIATGNIPAKVFQNTPMLVIIPDMEKVPIGIGGTLGKGILVARTKQQWSPPVFVSMAAGNWDFPQGAKTSDVLVIFKNGKGTGNLSSGKINVDASLAAVYAYSNSTVTEISLNTPAELEVERTLFANFYGEEVNVADVLTGKIAPNVNDVVQLKDTLATLTKK